MTRSIYRPDHGDIRRNLSPDEIAEALRAKDGLLWVDLSTADEDATGLLADTFGFHPLAIDDCFNDRSDTPKIDDYRDYLFIVAQSISYAAVMDHLQLVEVGTFLGPNYVVTVHDGEVAPVDELFQRSLQTGAFLERGADFLAHTILDSLVDLLLPAVEDMDEHIDELEQRVLERPDKELLRQVLLLKRNVLRLRRSILPQRDMVNRLSRGEFPNLIRPEAMIFYRDIYDHTVRVEEMLDGLRDLADSALSSYLSATNNRMNEVMKAMSVVAVIFLPLTLIASIYGTNLDYSSIGVSAEHGFYLMLAGMLVVAAGLIGYFRYRGWF